MTMPSERTRALISAYQLLTELQYGDDTPPAIRSRAISVLRHYPSEDSIKREAEWQMENDCPGKLEDWLLPVDYYDRKKPQS